MKRMTIDSRIRETAKRRLGGRGGFTLAETLLAVLIMLLVSVIVATGMPAVTNAYNKIVLGANAKVMLSTAITALHDEIGTAWQVYQASGEETKLSYFNASTGAKSELSLNATDKNAIWVQDYLSLSGDLIHDESYISGTAHPLLTDSKLGMFVTYTSIAYDSTAGIVTITGLKVCKKSDDAMVVAQFAGENGVAKPFTIRVISKDAIEP